MMLRDTALPQPEIAKVPPEFTGRIRRLSLLPRRKTRVPPRVDTSALMKRFTVFLCCHIWVAALSAQTNPFAVPDEAAFFKALDLDRPELANVREAVGKSDWSAAKQAWARHIETRQNPRWIWSHSDRERITRLSAGSFGGLEKAVPAADKVLARDFNLLGVRKQLAPKVEWLQGPVEWTHVLSRFAYWDDLGKAWWATGDAKYQEDFVRLLLDWVDSNPVPAKVSNERGSKGTVWRTLEAGIRAQSWFGAMEFFMDAPAFDPEAKFRMTRSLVEHARYLHAWSTKYRGGNWQVCEASGLATIGIMLPEFKEAAAWRERGLGMLTEHLRKDVGDDGLHWELTPTYHTWVMLEFLHASRLCEVNHVESPLPMDRHQRMFEALMKLMRPDGSFPAVGDAGQGNRMSNESLGLGALLYQRPDFRFFGPEKPDEKWLWLLGPAALDAYPAMEKRAPDFTSVLLPDANYAVMRTGWKPDDTWLMFDAAPWRGGHSHQDRLQVTLFSGRDLIQDAGMISYDHPDSKALRKSAAHSVLLIDEGEQLAADPVWESWHTSADLDFAAASVKAEGFVHRRSVLFVKSGYAIVCDTVSGGGSHRVSRLFQLPPCEVDAGTRSLGTKFPHGTNLRIEGLDESQVEMRKGSIAKAVTSVAANPVAAFVSSQELPATFVTALLPIKVGCVAPRLRKVPSAKADECRIEVETPDGSHDAIVIAPGERELECNGRRAKAVMLFVRDHGGKQTVTSVASRTR